MENEDEQAEQHLEKMLSVKTGKKRMSIVPVIMEREELKINENNHSD